MLDPGHFTVWFSMLVCAFISLSVILVLIWGFQCMTNIFSIDSFTCFMELIFVPRNRIIMNPSLLRNHVVGVTTGYLHISGKVMAPCSPLTCFCCFSFYSWSKSLCQFSEVYVLYIRFCPTSSPCAVIPRIIATNCQCPSEMKILISL